MIKVIIELHNANTKEILGEIFICNDATGTEYQGNYNITFYKEKYKIWRKEKLFSFPRKRLNVFYLLQRVMMKI